MRLATAPDKGFDKRAGESAGETPAPIRGYGCPQGKTFAADTTYGAKSDATHNKRRAQNTQWLCPQSTCKSKNLNKNAAFKKVRLDALLQRERARRKPCRESYFLFLGTVRMGEDIPSEGEQQPPSQSQEQSLPNSLPNAAMSMSAAHTSRLHEDTSHT